MRTMIALLVGLALLSANVPATAGNKKVIAALVGGYVLGRVTAPHPCQPVVSTSDFDGSGDYEILVSPTSKPIKSTHPTAPPSAKRIVVKIDPDFDGVNPTWFKKTFKAKAAESWRNIHVAIWEDMLDATNNYSDYARQSGRYDRTTVPAIGHYKAGTKIWDVSCSATSQYINANSWGKTNIGFNGILATATLTVSLYDIQTGQTTDGYVITETAKRPTGGNYKNFNVSISSDEEAVRQAAAELTINDFLDQVTGHPAKRR